MFLMTNSRRYLWTIMADWENNHLNRLIFWRVISDDEFNVSIRYPIQQTKRN